MAKRKQKRSPSKNGAVAARPDLTFPPESFINRETSWLEFNARVLEEAEDDDTPLLERVKFLSIFSSNLDEFFMVRVAGLREQAFQDGISQDVNADGIPAISQLRRIGNRTRQLINRQYQCLRDNVLPFLKESAIEIVPHSKVRKNPRLDRFFKQTVFPVLTPMAIDPSHPRPRYHNRALYVMTSLRRRAGLGPRSLYAVVQLPQVLPRLIPIIREGESDTNRFILLEDLVAARMGELFGGFEADTSACFRITRDSDIDVISQESDDMLRGVEERLKERQRADAVRLEVAADADPELVQMIVEQEQLHHGADRYGGEYNEVYRIPGPVDLTGFLRLIDTPNTEHLRDTPIIPTVPRGLRRHGESLFAAIRRRDILLHHPYDSFQPVVDFVKAAKDDPRVLAIKQTVYRTSGDSPIVQALIDAAEAGKHVTCLVELKARFDEAANVEWARQLERSGAHVVYGLMDLKTHCKVSLVVREEDSAVRRYVHLSTGNYNPTTARFYEDLGLFTSSIPIADDASALFNLLTGYSQGHEWKKLAIAPTDLQNKVLKLIDEQRQRAKRGKPSRIFAKLNSLVDPIVIEALYRASCAGVPIDLFIRGICCLRPGIKGVSENIRVRSIVDRFLEHSRLAIFGPDDQAKIYLSSADWMPRNFHRRVEVMFPIESPALQRRILKQIVPNYLRDNVKARELGSDGVYSRVKRKSNATPIRCQLELMEMHRDRAIHSRSRMVSDSPEGEIIRRPK